MTQIKQLLHDYIAVEVDKVEEKTSSGLYIKEQINTYPPHGTVMSVAPGVKIVKVGDRINYKVYASVDIDDGVAVIPESGIIAILNA